LAILREAWSLTHAPERIFRYSAPRMRAPLARTICPTLLLWAVGCGAPQTPGTDASMCRPFAVYRGLPEGAPHADARVWVEDLTSPELDLDGVCMILDDRWFLPLAQLEPHVSKWQGELDTTSSHNLLLLSNVVGYVDGLRFSGPVKSQHLIDLHNDNEVDLAAWIEPGGVAEDFTDRSLLVRAPRITWRQEQGTRASEPNWRPTKPWAIRAEEVISSMGPGLHACYRAALERRPNLEGSVRLAIDVAADGRVGSVKPTAPSEFDDGVLGCFARHIEGVTFSPPENGPVTLVLPMTFARDE
jgi:hypothetical protein